MTKIVKVIKVIEAEVAVGDWEGSVRVATAIIKEQAGTIRRYEEEHVILDDNFARVSLWKAVINLIKLRRHLRYIHK